jgi:hypothetical protein
MEGMILRRRSTLASRAAAALTLVVLAAGCDDATGPARLHGTFILESVGGDPLPAPTRAGGPLVLAPETIRGDTITFLGASARGFPRIAHRAWYNMEGGGARLSAYEEEYRLDGGTLVFIPPLCPPGANCIFVPRTGRVVDGRFVVTFESPLFRAQTFGPK